MMTSWMNEDESDKTEKYTLVAWSSEYPEEGTLPLGDKMSD
jgi:hypothetical protein